MKPTFRQLDYSTIDVLLEGRKVGRIAQERMTAYTMGWRYTPTGSKTGGELFETLAACKASL